MTDKLRRAIERRQRKPRVHPFDAMMAAAQTRRTELQRILTAALTDYARVAVEFCGQGAATTDFGTSTVFGYAIRLYRAGGGAPYAEAWVVVEATDDQILTAIDAAIARTST